MFYKFPTITNIDDVLPYVENHPNFIITTDKPFIVINYVCIDSQMFNIDSEDDGGIIRRECRGIIFDKNNHKIISRPFHKFFNVNEREETLIENLGLATRQHTIYEKLDGSMIRPIIVDNYTRLGTKMGITQTSIQAENALVNSPKYREKIKWLSNMAKENKTPILEFISPDNQIVVPYKKTALILLAIRDNFSGEYLQLENFESPFENVNSYDKISNTTSFINEIASVRDREGIVVCFGGHKVKIKADWYVNLHAIVGNICNEKMILKNILDNTLDDIKPALKKDLPNSYATIIAFEDKFWNAFNTKLTYLKDTSEKVIKKHNSNRKEIALDPTIQTENFKFIFGTLDNKNIRDMLLKAIRISTSSHKKFDNTMEWLTYQ